MFVLRPRRIGYRRDFCVNCRTIGVAERWSALQLLPPGRRAFWMCPRCRFDPHVQARHPLNGVHSLLTGMAALGAVGTLVAALGHWRTPEAIPIDPSPFVVLALITGVPAAVLRIGMGRRVRIEVAERLAEVEAAPMDRCLLCEGALDEMAQCRECGARRFPSPSRG